MFLKRNYLTSDEIGTIIRYISEKNSEYERQMIKYGLTAQFLVDGIKVDENTDCNNIYDQLVENNIDLDMSVKNFDMIERIMDRELSVASAISLFTTQATDLLKNYIDGFNAEELKNTLESLAKKNDERDKN